MNSLSNYILLQIFELLDENSLASAAKVCQRWSQLIISSISLMKRLTLTIVISNDQSFRVFGKVDSENYQNLIIKSDLKSNALSAEFYDYLDNYRETVKNLTLHDFQMSDVISTLDQLNSNNITKLVLIKCRYNLMRRLVIDLPYLSQLEIHSSIEFLSLINLECVKVLKISKLDDDREIFCRKHFEILNSCLENCCDLKELTLSNFSNRLMTFNLNIDEFKFNLVSLAIENSFFYNLQQFLLSQNNSLKNLVISDRNCNPELLKIIFYDLKLNQLELDTANMSQNFPFMDKNTTIKKLIIRKEKLIDYVPDEYFESGNISC